MKVLVLGSGAREHAVTWMFSKSNRLCGLYTAPGNAGTEALGENIESLDPMDSPQIIKTCKEKNIHFVFIGPEAPLAAGIADDLIAAGIDVFGPHREAAQLESSKVFSKQFMVRNNLPTARSEEFSDSGKFSAYIDTLKGKHVVKKSGLAAGKGVLESDDREELKQFGLNILKDDTLIVEDFLEGFEVSVFALTDGKNFKTLLPCADFKKAHDGDKGPNTGVMGAICPVPWVDQKLNARLEDIVADTFKALDRENLNYCGILYFGFMVTKDGPKLLEFNVRFGDPETQVLLPLIDSDFGDLMHAMSRKELDKFPLKMSTRSAVGVVIASEGYPGPYTKDCIVETRKVPAGTTVFHASTYRDKAGHTRTGGGRSLTATGLGQNLLEASINAYKSVESVSFKGGWYRSDIGKKFFLEKTI